MNVMIKDLQDHWLAISPILTIHNENEYDAAVDHLNDLLDEVGTDESHPLYELLDTLGTLVHVYEEEHVTVPEASGIDALNYLMDEHGLKQSDLPEVGSQGVVSEILAGKRQLNVRQIKLLSQKFHVSPAVFF